MRVDPVAGDLGCLVLMHPLVLALLSLATLRVPHFARGAEGALSAVPVPARDLVQADAVNVVPSVAEVAEEHLVLISRILEIGKLQSAKDM